MISRFYSLKIWKSAFDSIDTDHSGYLNTQEVRQLLYQLNYRRCTEAQIKQWMDSVDKDGDGQISFAEFCTFLEMSIQSFESLYFSQYVFGETESSYIPTVFVFAGASQMDHLLGVGDCTLVRINIDLMNMCKGWTKTESEVKICLQRYCIRSCSTGQHTIEERENLIKLELVN
ncbi:unnamed protein product [Echinostoma caproni]|uniref:EF-hand domain-containing protein n=1 Tax=Echinostoma caproni TaxID=27848 RepID=A0A183A4Y3_9TREM|nr:unnamed protein product [Echinostoma caproni]